VFTTIEQADLASSIRIVDTGGFKAYNRDQLLMDVYEACKHRIKPAEDAQALVLTITSDIVRAVDERGTISQDAVSGIIGTILQRFDPVAATVYTAYHK
jgi:transcriptional regulator NrdR family protein